MSRRVIIKWQDTDSVIHGPIINDIRRAAEESASGVVSDAKGNIHSISGRLAASGRTVGFTKKRAAGAYAIFGDSVAYYAFFVEAGTSDTRRRPYLSKAFARRKSEFIKKLRGIQSAR